MYVGKKTGFTCRTARLRVKRADRKTSSILPSTDEEMEVKVDDEDDGHELCMWA